MFPGFETFQTGGGCTALRCEINAAGDYILVTDGASDGGDAPDETTIRFDVGLYRDSDDTTEAEEFRADLTMEDAQAFIAWLREGLC